MHNNEPPSPCSLFCWDFYAKYSSQRTQEWWGHTSFSAPRQQTEIKTAWSRITRQEFTLNTRVLNSLFFVMHRVLGFCNVLLNLHLCGQTCFILKLKQLLHGFCQRKCLFKLRSAYFSPSVQPLKSQSIWLKPAPYIM